MNASDLRVVLIGTPEFSVASFEKILAAGYNVVGVITAPDRPAGRGMKLRHSAVKDFALANDLNVLQPTRLKSPEFVDQLKALKADIQVVIAFRMLPELVWNMPKLGTVNLHASLLPNYRGAAPINWAIINGEVETGLSTFRLKHEIDTGNILLQKKVQISIDDNAGSLHNKLMQDGADLMLQTLEGILSNALEEQPQRFTEQDKKAPKIFKPDCQINWDRNGIDVINHIRGLSPYPTAFTTLHNQKLKVYRASFTAENHTQFPGTLSTDNANFVGFYCLDGLVTLDEVQLEGRRKMPIGDLLRGLKT
jgi:methionyl-tRNA formyltransferase